MNETGNKAVRAIGYVVLALVNIFILLRAVVIGIFTNAHFFGELPTVFDRLRELIAYGEIPIVILAFYYLIKRKLSRAAAVTGFAAGYLLFVEFIAGGYFISI